MIKIGFDCDDILINLADAWLDEIYKLYGIRKTNDELNMWHISEVFKNEINEGKITKENIYDILYDPNFWKTIKPISGIYEILYQIKSIYNENVQFYIITASNYQTIYTKLSECVLKYYGDIFDTDNIIICRDKSMIDVDVLIDDYFGNIKPFLCKRSNSIAFVRKTPHSMLPITNTYFVDDIKKYLQYEIYESPYDLFMLLTSYINSRIKSDRAFPRTKSLKENLFGDNARFCPSILFNCVYRNESSSSGVTNIRDILTYEFNELGNEDIFDYLKDHFYGYNHSILSKKYWIDYTMKFLSITLNITEDNMRGVWLASMAAVRELYSKNGYDNIYKYDVWSTKFKIISDLGYDGKLFLYNDKINKEKAIKEEE